MQAGQMQFDRLYAVAKHGVVKLRYTTKNEDYVLVSSPGDLDMRHLIGVPVQEEVEEVSQKAVNSLCPACQSLLAPLARTEQNPDFRDHTHYCPNLCCGWVGRICEDSESAVAEEWMLYHFPNGGQSQPGDPESMADVYPECFREENNG